MRRRHGGSRIFGNEQLDARLEVGLIGHWVAGHGSGLSLYDRSGYGNHAVFAGSPIWTLGCPRQDRYAVQFAAGSDLLNCGSDPILDDLEAMSIAGWVRATDLTGEQILFTKYSTDGTLGWFIELYNGELWFYRLAIGTNRQFASTEVVAVNTWTHVAYTQVSSVGVGALYIGGVACTLAVNDLGDNLTSDAAQPFTLGGRLFDTSGLKGILDDVRVYSRVLTASEVGLLASPAFFPAVAVGRRAYRGVSAAALVRQQSPVLQAVQRASSW